MWQEIYIDEVMSVEYKTASDVPFIADIEATIVGDIVLGEMTATVSGVSRNLQNIAEDSRDGYLLMISKGAPPISGVHAGREYTVNTDGCVLYSSSEPLNGYMKERDSNKPNSWSNHFFPVDLLKGKFNRIHDFIGLGVDENCEALGLLRNYISMIENNGSMSSGALIAHASDTIVDLIGLTLGVTGDEAELAGLRGLRAARLEAVLGLMGRNYINPRLSAREVGRQLGLSERYVQDLLAATGLSFSERILEFRLQHACKLLGAQAAREMRIGDIIFASGFGDVSYFNRCFRRRFGCNPGSVR
tara:strand:+ start:3478 stop:4386 length:909 start_codon:yes stop_codon:yes gene_type:complete